MDAKTAIQLVLQLLALSVTLEPAIRRAVEDFQKMFEDGNEPTQADVDALLDRIKSQSAQIQNQPD